MEEKEEKIHKIKWSLKNHKIDFNEKQVRGELFMPSVLPRSYKGEWVCPPVMLDLHVDSADTAHALTIMRDTCSSNILKAKLVMKNKKDVLAWVEPFTGNLLDYLESKNLGIPRSKGRDSKITLPTPNLQSALRQVIKGLEDLCKSGNYHGGFSLAKTCYVVETSGVTIKLCNFKKKKGHFKNNLAEDWTAVKNGLLEILQIATKLKIRFPHLDCCQLDGLIEVLRNIGPFNSESSFEVVKRQPLFWGKEERRQFYISVIPVALSKDDFFASVNNAEFITLPWGEKNFDGFLSMMNNFQSKKGQPKYDTTSRVDLVSFISGLYTHEKELQAVLCVDVSVQAWHSGLCYRLYALLPRA